MEAAKRQLSDHPFARIEEEFIAEKDGQALHLSMEIDRDEYEEMIRPLLDRTMDCVQRALDDAQLTASQIDKVVLVGGSTRTPLIRRLLEERLGQPAHQEVNPDLCVAMGAAIQAGHHRRRRRRRGAGGHHAALARHQVPRPNGWFRLSLPLRPDHPPQHAPAGVAQRAVSTPFSDNQSEVEIDVYQGESDDVRHNHRVGRFLVQGLARVPAGNQIVVQLDLNLDGMLKVSAREKATGLQKQITIENPFASYEREERAVAQERLNRLWRDPEGLENEDLPESFEPQAVPELVAGPREGQRETVQSRALLEKAERIAANTQPQDRTELERLMMGVRNALTDRRWDELAKASNELSDVLFYLEEV